MAPATVLHIDDYRGRRDQRLGQTLALFAADADRSLILSHLHAALSIVEGDRAAVVWVDEYGPGLVHVHCLLDLGSDRPRRSFSMELLRRAWEDGVPGLYDFPDLDRLDLAGIPEGVRGGCTVALGSDGARAWFLAVDALTPRAPLESEVAETLMFLAGKCAAMVLHRDLAASPFVEGEGTEAAQRFAGWPILRDVEGNEDDDATARRITSRFLVTRLVRSLVEEDFAMDEDSIRYQVEGIRRELHTAPSSDPERQAWERVLEAAESPGTADLAGAVLELANAVEAQGHHHGALELHRTAYEVAMASGAVTVAVDSARFLGRVYRHMTEWEHAFRWYEVAGEVARSAGETERYTLVRIGLGNTHRVRGNLARAREVYLEALRVAEEIEERRPQAEAHHGLMVLDRNAEERELALDHGWQAVRLYPDEQNRLMALQDVAAVLVDLGDLGAADDAYTIVAARMGLRDYRIMALDGLVYVAALRGDREAFEERLRALEETEWESTLAPDYRGQILYYRGLSYQALGEIRKARSWLERALAFAEEHGLSKELFRAEEALDRLAEREGAEPAHTPSRTAGAPPTLPTWEGREELRQMRLEVVPAVGA